MNFGWKPVKTIWKIIMLLYLAEESINSGSEDVWVEISSFFVRVFPH